MGQDPASIHWRQIKTKHFRIIFPAENEKESRRLSFLLESSYQPVSQGLNHRPGITNVILHPRAVMSNGLVSWAPKRMELYPCPPQGIYAQEWLEQLALHEFRHVVQISKMNQGFTHWLNLLFGQQASSLVLGLFIPSWFMEGDAVATETALSLTGRGSYPIFESEFRAQLVEKGKYSYDKAVLGSYKDAIPDRYVLGYHLVGYGRITYGQELWQSAINKTARMPFMITPFSRGIKQVSGLSKDEFYKKALNSLDTLWTAIDHKNQGDVQNTLVPAHPLPYADYHFPAVMEDGSIFCLRTGMNDIPRFISFRPGDRERILYTPGTLAQDAVGYQSHKIIWTEEIPDIRWENRSYSVVKIRDLEKGQTRTLRKRTRFFAPSPSADFSKVVVSESSITGQNAIVILNTSDGSEEFRFSSGDNEQFLTPVFDDKATHILAIALGEHGKNIVEIDILTHRIRNLTQPSSIEINGPVYHDNRIIFVGAYSGIDGIYSLDTANSTISQVFASRFGIKDVGFKGTDSLLFSNYQYGGHRPTVAFARPGKSLQKNNFPEFGTRLDSSLRAIEGRVNFNDKSLQDSELVMKAKPYYKLLHLFHFHSWAPAYIDAGNQNINPGIQFLSQNMLSTSTLSLGWEYNQIEQEGRFKANYTYLGWFPLLDLKFEDGLRAFERSNGIRYTYYETDLKARLSLPLNFSRNKYYRFIQPYIGTTLEIVKHTSSSPSDLFEGNIQILDWGFYAHNILRYTNKDIFPRWGQSLNLVTRQTPWGDAKFGDIYCGTANLFFPRDPASSQH